MERGKLYYGAAYFDQYLPKSRAQEDMKLMQEAGMNVIRFGISAWKAWEPREGEFDFTSFHNVLSAAQARQMDVIIVVPTDVLPPWLEKKPEDYARCSERMIRKLVCQCSPYSCVVGFQLGINAREPEEIRRQTVILRACIRPEQFITRNIQADMKDFHWNNENPFETAELTDIAGCSVYHNTGCRTSGGGISLCADMTRGLKKENFLVLDTQCQGEIGQLPYPGQLRLAAYHHLSGGAEGVLYEQWHSDYRGSKKGVLNHDLIPDRIYNECAQIGNELHRLGEPLTGIKKQNRVAILVSRNSMDQAVWAKESGRDYGDYLRWVYDSFFRLNIEVDIIPDTQRDFTGYELLVVPSLYCAEDNLIWAIRNFVADGGYLIATFRSFFADENGVARSDVQPYGMTDVFGMSYSEYTVPHETTLPEFASDVEDWMELLNLSRSRAIAEYGGPGWKGIPAATCSRFGKGGAAYIGCYSPDGLDSLLLRLLATWHIPVPETSWPVVMKRGINRHGRPITFLLHYSPAARVIPSPAAGRELLSGQQLEEGAPLELKPWDVKILEGTI